MKKLDVSISPIDSTRSYKFDQFFIISSKIQLENSINLRPDSEKNYFGIQVIYYLLAQYVNRPLTNFF